MIGSKYIDSNRNGGESEQCGGVGADVRLDWLSLTDEEHERVLEEESVVD